MQFKELLEKNTKSKGKTDYLLNRYKENGSEKSFLDEYIYRLQDQKTAGDPIYAYKQCSRIFILQILDLEAKNVWQ